MGKLDGKVAVITGRNSGIGLATAKRFVKKECRSSSRDGALPIMKPGQRNRRELHSVPGRRKHSGADRDRLYMLVKEKAGHIDVFFANADGGSTSHTSASPVGPVLVAHEAQDGQQLWLRELTFAKRRAITGTAAVATSNATCGIAPTPLRTWQQQSFTRLDLGITRVSLL